MYNFYGTNKLRLISRNNKKSKEFDLAIKVRDNTNLEGLNYPVSISVHCRRTFSSMLVTTEGRQDAVYRMLEGNRITN